MKRCCFILSIIFAVGLASCNDDEPGGGSTAKKSFDMNATISVSAKKQAQKRSIQDGVMSYEDSVKFVAKYAWMWKYDSHGGLIGTAEQGIEIGSNRDTINNKFLWSGITVIQWERFTPEGDTIYKLGPFVSHLTDLILVAAIKEDGTPYIANPDQPGYVFVPSDYPADTVGYIPNSVVLRARELITEAFNRKDFDRCYELFDSAYVFIPITGERYRELKARGEN